MWIVSVHSAWPRREREIDAESSHRSVASHPDHLITSIAELTVKRASVRRVVSIASMLNFQMT
jgi:hypothetical protein